MEITSFWPVFFFAVGFQGLFLAAILFIQKKANEGNFYLALLISLFSISIVDTIIFWTSYDCENPGWLGISLILTFLYGPLFYFYLTRQGVKSNALKNRWLHLVPVIIAFAWHFQYILANSAMKLEYIKYINHNLFNFRLIPMAALFSLLFYAWLSYQHVIKLERKHGLKILKSWHWLALITKAYWLFVALHILYFISIVLGRSTQSSDIMIVLGYSVFIYAIGYLALKTSKLFNGIKVDTSKYQSNALNGNFSASVFEKLEQHMALNKPFKNNEIKLAGLAAELSLAPHQLSQVINQQAHQNFAEYINAYRIEEARALILEMDRMNELAYEVGFNNRTTFNKEFKKHTGLTPTAYKKQYLNGSEKLANIKPFG